jgi:hypothetical protein
MFRKLLILMVLAGLGLAIAKFAGPDIKRYMEIRDM